MEIHRKRKKGGAAGYMRDGRQSRDFIYVRETARASVLAMKKGKPGEVYNGGTGRSTDFNTIFGIIKEEMKYEKEAKHILNPLKSYQIFKQADISKATRELDFILEYDLRKGGQGDDPFL
jgi:UDP-glucose 4-epimerase